ncbi:MAG: hypothetical protein RLZZ427_1740 [Pseudomonadota bacterium]|jgi:Flp pilus assembly protein TadG
MMLRCISQPILLRQLSASQTGTSVVEAAILLPGFVMLFAMLFDLSAGFAQKLRVQQAAVRTVEYALNSDLETVTPLLLTAEAANNAKVPMSQVTLNIWQECNGVKSTDITVPCADAEQTARWLSISISSSYTPVLGRLLPTTLAPDGTITVVGQSQARLQ